MQALAERPLRSALPHARSALPRTMCAVAIDGAGGAFALHALPVPVPGPSEVLIALDTAGVARRDLVQPAVAPLASRLRSPFVPGIDGAGIVAGVGARVHRFAIGNRVHACAFDAAGFYAEYVAVAADKVAHVPRAFDLQQAAAMAASGLAALQGIDDALQLKPDESVIVHGACGDVGTLAIQFAKLRGARVFATAGEEEGTGLARRLGADIAVDERRADLAAEINRFAPEGVDAVLALTAGDALERCLDTVPGGGRLAYPRDVEPVLAKRHGIKVIAYDPIAGADEFERLRHAVRYARLEVAVAQSYPLAEAARAHERLAHGQVPGKLVLRIH